MILLISCLIGCLFLLVLNLVTSFIRGDTGKRGELNELFLKLEGELDQKEKKQRRYKSINRIAPSQYLKLFIPIGILVYFISFLFFRSPISALIITLASTVYPYMMINERKKKLKRLLNYQLRDALNALSASLKAGSSLNNALMRTYDDLTRIYATEKDKPIVDAFSVIAYEIDLMIPVEDVLSNFAKTSDLEDISDFVNVTLMTRRQGGDLNEVISRITQIISDRIEVEHEIGTLVSGKKLEAKVLTVLPIVLVILLSLMSPEYMAPMYQSTLGKILMIFAALLLAINYIVGKKIIDIEV